MLYLLFTFTFTFTLLLIADTALACLLPNDFVDDVVGSPCIGVVTVSTSVCSVVIGRFAFMIGIGFSVVVDKVAVVVVGVVVVVVVVSDWIHDTGS